MRNVIEHVGGSWMTNSMGEDDIKSQRYDCSG